MKNMLIIERAHQVHLGPETLTYLLIMPHDRTLKQSPRQEL